MCKEISASIEKEYLYNGLHDGHTCSSCGASFLIEEFTDDEYELYEKMVFSYCPECIEAMLPDYAHCSVCNILTPIDDMFDGRCDVCAKSLEDDE